jgi:hypothetical protein
VCCLALSNTEVLEKEMIIKKILSSDKRLLIMLCLACGVSFEYWKRVPGVMKKQTDLLMEQSRLFSRILLVCRKLLWKLEKDTLGVVAWKEGYGIGKQPYLKLKTPKLECLAWQSEHGLLFSLRCPLATFPETRLVEEFPRLQRPACIGWVR